jgi:hypothetical protein
MVVIQAALTLASRERCPVPTPEEFDLFVSEHARQIDALIEEFLAPLKGVTVGSRAHQGPKREG